MICEYCEDQPAYDPLHNFRDHHVIYLADVDGMLWASNSFWAVPVPDSQHRIARLFEQYNLTTGPGTYVISDTLTRTKTSDIKDIKTLVLAAIPPGLEKVSPVQINGAQVYVKGVDDQCLAVFDIPGGIAVVDADRLRLTEDMAPEGEWYASSDPNKMFVRKTDDDRVTAVLMPMKHVATSK